MSREKDLIKNTGILMIAKISTQVVSFFLLPLYTALLTTADYGRVDIYTTLSMIVVPFLTLQVEMALFRFFITDKYKDSQKEIISTSYAIIIFMVTITSLIYVIVSCVFNLQHRWLLLAYYLTMALSAILLQTCRAQSNNIGYGIASFISSALAVGLNVLFIAGLRWKVEGILIASILAHLISCIYMIWCTKVYRYFSINAISFVRGKELLRYAIPLVFNQISSWAINYSNRVIILARWGEGINGIFAVASKFSNLTGTFFNVYNVAWTENVVRSMDDKDCASYISKIFELTFNVYLVLVTGIINLLPFVFSFLVNKAFNEAYLHVPILLVGMLFSGMAATLGSIYIAYNKTIEVSITTMLTGAANILLHLALLSSCKLYAASISTLISFAALLVCRYIGVKKFFEIKFDIKSIAVQILALVFCWYAYSTEKVFLILFGLLLNMVCIVRLIKKNDGMIKQFIKKKL